MSSEKTVDMRVFQVPKELIHRQHKEAPLPPYRSEFMRDRDRVLYATAFRRLAGKTQIYTVGADDHKRNRLTHTLEVAQIARTIARGLNLDENLAEAIALAHDFGHTPFGHAGERTLNKIMIPSSPYIKKSPFYHTSEEDIKNCFMREADEKQQKLEGYAYGFKHNLQSVRVAAVLEDSYRDEKGKNIGLNLTNYTLYGIMIHSELAYRDENDRLDFYKFFEDSLKAKGSQADAWSFEAYIVKAADEFSQWHHDLEDALRGGALPIDKICTTIEESLGDCLTQEDKDKLKDIQENNSMDRKHLADLSHVVVNTLVDDMIKTSQANFQELYNKVSEYGIQKIQLFTEYDMLKEKYPDLPEKDQIIQNSDEIKKKGFRTIISKSVHHSRNVERMNAKGQYIIRKLFEAYYNHPQQLPDGPILHLLVDAGVKGYDTLDAARKKGYGQIRMDFDEELKNPTIFFKCMLMRRICDHIASMTDRYAIEEYDNLYG